MIRDCLVKDFPHIITQVLRRNEIILADRMRAFLWCFPKLDLILAGEEQPGSVVGKF